MVVLGESGGAGGGSGGESSLQSAITTLQIKNENAVKAQHAERPLCQPKILPLIQRSVSWNSLQRGGAACFPGFLLLHCPVFKPGEVACILGAASVPKAMLPKL